jgi:hypothetical protein
MLADAHPRVPPFARVAYKGVVACGIGVATRVRSCLAAIRQGMSGLANAIPGSRLAHAVACGLSAVLHAH